MILVLKEIYNRLKKKCSLSDIGHYSLENHFKKKGINLAFGRKPIKKIINYLKKNKLYLDSN
jgi:hypothetical protein